LLFFFVNPHAQVLHFVNSFNLSLTEFDRFVHFYSTDGHNLGLFGVEFYFHSASKQFA
jgi:hypothetical protein